MTLWRAEHLSGPAAELHRRPLPDDGQVVVSILDVTAPAVVLGSAQPAEVLVEGAERVVEVARRRGGGGAVWLAPGAQVWIDVFVPRGHARWDDDVGRAFLWLGRAVAESLVVGGAPGAAVADMTGRGRWSTLVCFAGTGPGEVSVGERKVWGWSQRRTRAGARFMGVGYRKWDAVPLLGLLRLTADERAEAAAELSATTVGLDQIGVEAQGFATDLVARIGAAAAA